MVNGIDELAVTNIDGLDTVETIKVCIGYRDGGKQLRLRAERHRGAGAVRAGLCGVPGLADADAQGADVEGTAGEDPRRI